MNFKLGLLLVLFAVLTLGESVDEQRFRRKGYKLFTRQQQKQQKQKWRLGSKYKYEDPEGRFFHLLHFKGLITTTTQAPPVTTGTTPPDTTPPDTTPPVTTPPVTTPPVTTPPDTSPPDTSPPDTSPPDTSPPDTSPPDTSPPDTSPPDTSPPDTSPPDTSPPDTSPPDTSPPDTTPPVPPVSTAPQSTGNTSPTPGTARSIQEMLGDAEEDNDSDGSDELDEGSILYKHHLESLRKRVKGSRLERIGNNEIIAVIPAKQNLLQNRAQRKNIYNQQRNPKYNKPSSKRRQRNRMQRSKRQRPRVRKYLTGYGIFKKMVIKPNSRSKIKQKQKQKQRKNQPNSRQRQLSRQQSRSFLEQGKRQQKFRRSLKKGVLSNQQRETRKGLKRLQQKSRPKQRINA